MDPAAFSKADASFGLKRSKWGQAFCLCGFCTEVRDERVDDPAQEDLHHPAILFWPRHFPSSRGPDLNLEKDPHLRRAVSFAVARAEKSRSKLSKLG